MSKLQTTQGRYDGVMEMKSKLYLRIILLISYMMKENLFVYVECSSLKHETSRFSVRKNVTQKKKNRKNEKAQTAQTVFLNLRRLQLARINNSETKFISFFPCVKRK